MAGAEARRVGRALRQRARAARALLGPALLALGSGCVALHGEDRPAATPQRPTFSSDTNTTAEDSFELEFGVLVDPSDSTSAPATLKYGAGESTELFFGSSPYTWIDADRGDASGIGDSLLGARHRFWENDAGTSAALQFATKLPTADDDVGTGVFDVLLAGIVSQALDGGVGLTAYYESGWLGRPDDRGTDQQHLLALAGSKAFSEELALFGELAGFARERDADPVFLTLGLTHTQAASLVWDAGFVVGLNDDAPDLQFLVGFTTNFGRVR